MTAADPCCPIGQLDAVSSAAGKDAAFPRDRRDDGSVWGSGPFTTDSSLATAAVHSGVLRAGQTGIVRVTIVPRLAPLPVRPATAYRPTTSATTAAYRIRK